MPSLKTILLFTDWFPPAYKGGGPIRSCVNFARAMAKRYQLKVVTSAYDFGEEEPLEGIVCNEWQAFGENIEVIYLERGAERYGKVKALMQEVAPDFIYLNSMFSKVYTIFPLWILRRVGIGAKVVLAPRGMLHKGALQYKRMKKRVFLALLKGMGIEKRLYFHATDEQEKRDILQHLNAKPNQISILPNFPESNQRPLRLPTKSPGNLRLLFISRISPKKNLRYLLDRLQALHTPQIHLQIIGPTEDAAYWQQCQAQIAQLPSNVTVEHIGERPYEALYDYLLQCHLYALPTFGENFGHSIFEAFVAGRPVLISDQTPWRQLAFQQIGWDLPLDQPKAFEQAIQRMADMTATEYEEWAKASWKFAEQYLQDTALIPSYQQLFTTHSIPLVQQSS